MKNFIDAAIKKNGQVLNLALFIGNMWPLLVITCSTEYLFQFVDLVLEYIA